MCITQPDAGGLGTYLGAFLRIRVVRRVGHDEDEGGELVPLTGLACTPHPPMAVFLLIDPSHSIFLLARL